MHFGIKMNFKLPENKRHTKNSFIFVEEGRKLFFEIIICGLFYNMKKQLTLSYNEKTFSISSFVNFVAPWKWRKMGKNYLIS